MTRTVGGEAVVGEGAALGHVGMRHADEQGGRGVGAALTQVVLHGVVRVVGEVDGAVLAALAEHPEPLRPDVASVERAGLGDAAAGADQQVDERPVAEVAQAPGRQRGEKTRHRGGGHGVGIADDVARHGHLPAQLSIAPTLVVRVGKELAQRDQRAGTGPRVGQDIGELDLVAAQRGSVDAAVKSSARSRRRMKATNLARSWR